MKISYKTDYALKTVLDLAKQGKGAVVQVSEIATRQDIPTNFLEQILLILKGAGVVISKRGPSGGYSLAMDPSDIPLSKIVRLFEGHLSPITCVSKSCYTHCDYEKTCPFREVWDDIRDYITSKLDSLSIKDMGEREKQLKGVDFLEYVI